MHERETIAAGNIGVKYQDKVIYSSIIPASEQAPKEIPEQVDQIIMGLAGTGNLLQVLHQTLADVMPPSQPEPTGVDGTAHEPSSPLGLQLSAFNKKINEHNASIRYLLERIKL